VVHREKIGRVTHKSKKNRKGKSARTTHFKAHSTRRVRSVVMASEVRITQVIVIPGNGCVPIERCNWYRWLAECIRQKYPSLKV
jgi:hypothetical protein